MTIGQDKHLPAVVRYLEHLLAELSHIQVKDTSEAYPESVHKKRVVNEDGIAFEFRWDDGTEVVIAIPWTSENL